MSDLDGNLPIYDDLFSEEQVKKLINNDDYVVASDVYPPQKANVQIMSMEDAFDKEYEQSDFINPDIAIACKRGHYAKDGVRFVLVPFMLHRSFRGF